MAERAGAAKPGLAGKVPPSKGKLDSRDDSGRAAEADLPEKGTQRPPAVDHVETAHEAQTAHEAAVERAQRSAALALIAVKGRLGEFVDADTFAVARVDPDAPRGAKPGFWRTVVQAARDRNKGAGPGPTTPLVTDKA